MPTKLFISNERMLLLMEWAIQTGIANNERDYLQQIGFPPTNISNARTGHQSFTKEHILKACEITGASADYIFGFTSQRLRKPARKSIDMLKETVHAIELELKKRV